MQQKDVDVEMNDESSHEQDFGTTYRYVNKEYYCYICQMKLKKMVEVTQLINEGMTCSKCGQGFCEIIDLDNNDLKGMIQAGMQIENQPLRNTSNYESFVSSSASMIDKLQEQNKAIIVNNENNQIQNDSHFTQNDNQIAIIQEDDNQIYSQVNVPPKVPEENRRENLINTNKKCDQFGRPLDRLDLKNTSLKIDDAGRPLGGFTSPIASPQHSARNRLREEEKKSETQISQQQNNRRGNLRVVAPRNPFSGFGNFFEDFFGDESPFFNMEQEEILSQSQSSQSVQPNNRRRQVTVIRQGGPGNFSSITRIQQQIPQLNQNQQRNQDQQRLFNEFFRPFSFTSMFNDDPFQDLSDFQDFNPHEFGINYNQNFRSSMNRESNQSQQNQRPQNQGLGFFSRRGGAAQGGIFGFDDFIQQLHQHMAQAQEAQERANRRPTSENVLSRLPVVKIEQKHCKKKEGVNEFEMPVCSVCICDFELGQDGMFLPCGHTFHPACIKPWLKDHNTCPVCRKELPSQ